MTAPPTSLGRWLTILGIGEDGVEGLSAPARAALSAADIVFGGQRHLALAAPLITGEARPWASPLLDSIPDILSRRGQKIVVLASGDPFYFGIGATLTPYIPVEEITCFPALSSVCLARARLGWSAQDCDIISLCGRPLSLLYPLLQPGARLLLLSADSSTPGAVAALLRERGFGKSRLDLLEALGGPHERVRHDIAESFTQTDINPLNLIAVTVLAAPDALVQPLGPGRPDSFFEHDGQITKQEIRAVTLAALSPRQGELLWDIGCGSGAIGIEWMLLHPRNRAIGIEARPDRAERARRNATARGVPGFEVRLGNAPAALSGLAAPDAVFIGGGATTPAMLETVWQMLKPGGRLVINSVTLETDSLLSAALHRFGGTLTRLSVERLDMIGRMHAYRPAMTVTQWAATKGVEAL